MGRLLVFLARLNQPDTKPAVAPPAIRGIGVQERAAVLLEPDGKASVVGNGDAYFIDAQHASGTIEKGVPLDLRRLRSVLKIAPGDTFDLNTWTGEGIAYTLKAESGKIRSTQTAGEIY